MTVQVIPLSTIKLWEPTCRLALSQEAMLDGPWRAAVFDSPQGMVLVTLTPSSKHPGFIDYEMLALKTGHWITSRKPVPPSHVGDFIAGELKRWGIDAQALAWRKVQPVAPSRKAAQYDAAAEFVYFLAGGPFVKIGKSTGRPDARIPELRTGCPYPLKLLAHLNGGLREERALHKRFAAARVHGEWFRHDGELAHYIRELQQAAVEEL